MACAKAVLDLGTGTADLAIAAALDAAVRVRGVDPSAEMLSRGRLKVLSILWILKNSAESPDTIRNFN